MLDYLRWQDDDNEEETQVESSAQSGERTQLTRFLPTSGRMFLGGLAWGLLVFAVIMLLGSTMALSSSVVRCLALFLPLLATFVVWRWYAWRETGQ